MSERSITNIEDQDEDEADVFDPDDAPILTAEMASRAQISVGGKVIREADPPLGKRRGRPPKREEGGRNLLQRPRIRRGPNLRSSTWIRRKPAPPRWLHGRRSPSEEKSAGKPIRHWASAVAGRQSGKRSGRNLSRCAFRLTCSPG